MIIVLDKFHIVAVAVVVMAEPQTGDELVRLGNLRLCFDETVTLHERECLAAGVWPLRLDFPLVSRPRRTILTFAGQAKARRNSLSNTSRCTTP